MLGTATQNTQPSHTGAHVNPEAWATVVRGPPANTQDALRVCARETTTSPAFDTTYEDSKKPDLRHAEMAAQARRERDLEKVVTLQDKQRKAAYDREYADRLRDRAVDDQASVFEKALRAAQPPPPQTPTPPAQQQPPPQQTQPPPQQTQPPTQLEQRLDEIMERYDNRSVYTNKQMLREYLSNAGVYKDIYGIPITQRTTRSTLLETIRAYHKANLVAGDKPPLRRNSDPSPSVSGAGLITMAGSASSRPTHSAWVDRVGSGGSSSNYGIRVDEDGRFGDLHIDMPRLRDANRLVVKRLHHGSDGSAYKHHMDTPLGQGVANDLFNLLKRQGLHKSRRYRMTAVNLYGTLLGDSGIDTAGRTTAKTDPSKMKRYIRTDDLLTKLSVLNKSRKAGNTSRAGARTISEIVRILGDRGVFTREEVSQILDAE